jgi:hypothetical protein
VYASCSHLQVHGYAWAGAEHRHHEMCAVQLLDILSALRMFRKQSRAPAAAAPQGHWGRSFRNTVLPLATDCKSQPSSNAALQPVHHIERFLWVLATIQLQGVMADQRSAPPCHCGGPATDLCVPARGQLASELKKEGQFKLVRRPWSMMGKEVRVQAHHMHGRHARR